MRTTRYAELVCFFRVLLRARAASHAGALLGLLSRMHDSRQAAMYLGDWLRHLPAEAIVSVLDAVLERAEHKTPGADLAVGALLHPALRSGWEKGLSRRVQFVARREGRFDLATILLELPRPDARFGPPAAKIPKDLEDVPLGTRKSWARRRDAYLMERLLGDPDRSVINNLLDNPGLMMRDVVKLASKTSTAEEVLETIALHRRWISQYKVKVTLAHNPSTPVRIALGLLHMLMSPELESLAKDSRLSRVVVRRAEIMLCARKRRQAM